MTPEQEPKYYADSDGQIRNRASGEVIPNDEPVFILRARDVHAVDTLTSYIALCNDPAHRDIVTKRRVDFHNFAAAYPDRMKEPHSP